MMDDLFSMVEIEINSNCNRQCPYCPNSILQRKEQGVMKRSVYERILTQLQTMKYSGRLSYHFYGEPLLCPKLVEYIALSKECLPQTRRVLYSNGDYLNAAKIEELFHAGVNCMVVTQHQGSDHRFEQVLQELDPDVTGKIVCLRHKDLELTNRGGLLPETGKRIQDSTVCCVPASLIVITLLGNVLPCFEDYEQKHSMGNVMTQTLEEIWNSKRYRQFREELSQGHRKQFTICRQCNNDSVQHSEQFDYVL